MSDCPRGVEMNQYAHMCRMDHEEIGFNTDSERCPLCRQMDGNDALNRHAAKLEADCKRYREALREIADEARRVLIETPKDKDPMMMAPWVAGRAYEALREAEDYPTKED